MQWLDLAMAIAVPIKVAWDRQSTWPNYCCNKKVALCRLDDSCTYNAPNFVSALILSVATQMTIGAVSLTSLSVNPSVFACLP